LATGSNDRPKIIEANPKPPTITPNRIAGEIRREFGKQTKE